MLGLVAVYAYRAPLMRFAAPVMLELDPSRVIEITDPDGGSELIVARGRDGHFHIDGRRERGSRATSSSTPAQAPPC